MLILTLNTGGSETQEILQLFSSERFQKQKPLGNKILNLKNVTIPIFFCKNFTNIYSQKNKKHFPNFTPFLQPLHTAKSKQFKVFLVQFLLQTLS